MQNATRRAGLFLGVALVAHAAWGAPGDGEAVTRLVAEVESAPRARVVAREVALAKQALARARSARSAGDAASGDLLEGVARGWAEAARDELAAADAESALVDAQRRLNEATTQLERNRAMLEETLSRRGRARVELERAEADAAGRGPVDARRGSPSRKPAKAPESPAKSGAAQ